MADKKPPSLYDIIERVLARVPGPVPIDEVAKCVLAIYPSRAKNPLTSVRSTLRLEHAGKTLVFLDRQTLVPLHVAMQGVRFRIPLTREEVDRGVLCIAPAFDCFRRQGLAHQDMHLLDAAGNPLTSREVTLKQQVTGPKMHRSTMPDVSGQAAEDQSHLGVYRVFQCTTAGHVGL
jgi:hypothetical protein